MDAKTSDVEALTYRVEQLQRERDDLRKDIEQLCMQQAGPSYVAVATRLHFQRTAGLEQEIENLQKKLVACLRENKDLKEELAEAYRIKTQLADLHSAELLKNKEAEKQLKYFQSSIAAVFAERDNSLMECEKAREQEEAMSKKLKELKERMNELQSAYLGEKTLNDVLQIELKELKNLSEPFVKIINKFYEVREREIGYSSNTTLEEKCGCLLDDSLENWIFSRDGGASTSNYITSLEEEKESLRNSINKLQSNLRMGLQIEQHLKRNIHSLKKKQKLFHDLIANGLADLQNFCNHHRFEIMKIFEEEQSHLKAIISEVQEKLSESSFKAQLDMEGHKEEEQINEAEEELINESECKDVHISTDIDSSDVVQSQTQSLATSITDGTLDISKALSQALQEKVAALLLLSQQEERHLLERNMSEALQNKIGELQRNLSQVSIEKVEVLLELAKLKQEYQLLKDHCVKHGDCVSDDAVRSISTHDQGGKLKNFLKTTYLKRWIKKEATQGEADVHESSSGISSTFRANEHSVDLARLRIENATFQERMANMEHLTSSIRRLHILLLKAWDDLKSDGGCENVYEVLNIVTTEANLTKTALGTVLPISWSGDASDAVTYESLYEPEDSSASSKTEKVDAASAAGLEMVELLILAAKLLKDSLI